MSDCIVLVGLVLYLSYVWRYLKYTPLSVTHPSILLYITLNSYCSFAVKTQVSEPLKQSQTLQCGGQRARMFPR